MITITINAPSAERARREMLDLIGPGAADAAERLEKARAGMAEAVRNAPTWINRGGASYEHQEVAVDLGGLPAETVPADEEKITTNTPRAGESEEQTQARRGRGRPRKNPVTIDGESTPVSETTTPEQIDLEDVIAAKADAHVAAVAGQMFDETIETPEPDEAPEDQAQPADPDKGWTHDDAKAVARQMYVRLGLLQQHELDERLHNNLQKFNVQRIKDLALGQIEAFVRGIESEVA